MQRLPLGLASNASSWFLPAAGQRVAQAMVAITILLAPCLAQAGEPRPDASDAPREAAAADESRSHAPDEPMKSRWYGWQILATDGTAVALLTVPAVSGSVAAIYPSLGIYAFGGPVIHAAHGRWGIAALSFGARALIPIGSTLGGMAIDEGLNGGGELAGLVGSFVGMFVGLSSAMALDASALSWERVPQVSSSSCPTPCVAWQPTARVRPTGDVDVGVVGTF